MANEKRLIDADALLKEHCGGCSLAQQKMCENDPVCGSAMWIVEAPTVDAVEVVHARWIAYESDETYGPYDSKEWHKCSNCGKDAYGRCYDDEWYSSPILSDYCPKCGAKMDGGNEDEKPLR